MPVSALLRRGARRFSFASWHAGLSFAALAELVISVACLGNNLEDTVTLLRGLDDHQPNSKEFDRPGAMGFGPARSKSDNNIPF